MKKFKKQLSIKKILDQKFSQLQTISIVEQAFVHKITLLF